jgi:23S rRNA pseudouridine1911/1915/1917 synthase
MKIKRDTILKVKEEMELMDFLGFHLQGKSKNNLKSLLTHGQITVDNQIVSQYNHKLEIGQEVKINWNKDRDVKKMKGIKILFEDDHIIIANKEEGVLSVSTGGKNENTAYNKLKDHVKSQDPKNKIFIVHRLDKNTSGIMMFAKSAEAQQILQSNWKHYILSRKYTVLVEGRIKEDKGTITSWLKENSAFVVYSSKFDNGGKKAITNYEVIKKNTNYTLLEASLETGRKNQIRVHMQDLGHPIVGDKKYGANGNPIKRLGLHARVLQFIHPITGKEYKFETTIPGAFEKVFKRMRRK